MPALRHPRREAFALARAEGKGLTESYAEAGYRAHAGNAYRLSRNEQICRRVLEIQTQSVQRTVTTIEDMIAHIDEDRRFARERCPSAPALAAEMGKAKLLGFLAEQPAVELNFNYSTMTEAELMSEIAAIHQQARAIKQGKVIDY